MPAGGDVFTTDDFAWAGASLRHLAGAMHRCAVRLGRTDDLAETALRLARVLREGRTTPAVPRLDTWWNLPQS